MTLSLPFLPVEVVIRRKAAGPARRTIRGAMVAIATFAVLLGLGLHLAGLRERSRRFEALARDYFNRSTATAWLADETDRSAEKARAEAVEAETSARDLIARGDGPGSEARRRFAEERRSTATRLDESAARLGAKAARLDRLVRKYQWARDRPLWPVGPDPVVDP